MNDLEIFWMQVEAERVGKRCIQLYLWSRGEAQWRVDYQSTDGQWEWFFW